MKRKLALILAGVMALTMLPMNLMAASTNRITKTATAVPEASMFYEEKAINSSVSGTRYVTTDSGDVEHMLPAGELKLTLRDDLDKGDSVELKLTNAEWFFRGTPNAGTVATPGALLAALRGAGLDSSDAATYDPTLADYAIDYSDTREGYSSYDDRDIDNLFTDPANHLEDRQLNYDSSKGVYFVNKYEEGFYVRTNGTPIGTTNQDGEPNYKLTIAASNPSVAVLEALEDISDEDTITVPVVVLTTEDEADVRIRVAAGAQSSISSSEMNYAISQGSGTVTSVDTVEAARKKISLGKIVVKESRIASFGESGSFEIYAPTGYTFNLKASSKISYELGLRAPNAPDVTFGYKPKDTSSRTPIPVNGSGAHETDVLLVNVTSGDPLKISTTVPGSITLSDIELLADSGYEAKGKVELRIKNVPYGGNDLNVTSQSFEAANFLDWTINFQATSKTIPQLVNGRYADAYDSNYDDFHKASTVKFSENAVSAWWARRETAFTLPEGVKFRSVEITDSDNLVQPKVIAGKNEVVDFKGTDIEKTWDPQYDDTTTPTEPTPATYVNDIITVDEDKIEIYDMQIKQGKKAMLEFDPWISIAAGFEGDVQLTATGSAIPEDLPPVVIAKAISPVTVKTKVTDIKIGYQYQPVADIEITENLAGALVKDEDVRLSVTDMINTEMWFSPETKVEITSGDLKLGTKKTGFFRTDYKSFDVGVNGGGSIGFAIDKPSSKASTIKLSNVAVKVDRSVPETNDRPYDIYVWGSAIAKNYKINSDSAAKNPGEIAASHFDKPGVHAPYLKVVSAANDRTSVLTQEVRVTKEQPSYTVNGEVFDMPAAAYISEKSNSMMVPIRFVANAFGIPDDQIIWSDTDKTVTLVHPSRTIQFKVDSDELILNGAKTRMASPDGKAVTPENKDSRVYIPFRQLGTAFGIDVGWDQATNTAIYNPGKAITNNGVSQTATTADPAATTTPATTK